jgi:ABC-type proline/glycine betaine transport system permease subunit
VKYFIEYSHPNENETDQPVACMKITVNLSVISDIDTHIAYEQDAAFVTMFNAALGGYGSVVSIERQLLHRLLIPISLPSIGESAITIIKYMTSMVSLSSIFAAIGNGVNILNAARSLQQSEQSPADETKAE